MDPRLRIRLLGSPAPDPSGQVLQFLNHHRRKVEICLKYPPCLVSWLFGVLHLERHIWLRIGLSATPAPGLLGQVFQPRSRYWHQEHHCLASRLVPVLHLGAKYLKMHTVRLFSPRTPGRLGLAFKFQLQSIFPKELVCLVSRVVTIFHLGTKPPLRSTSQAIHLLHLRSKYLNLFRVR